jgi:hypothetical protein
MDMSATLYIKTKDVPTFEAFAKRVFPLLGI